MSAECMRVQNRTFFLKKKANKVIFGDIKWCQVHGQSDKRASILLYGYSVGRVEQNDSLY